VVRHGWETLSIERLPDALASDADPTDAAAFGVTHR
jgi:hypothetical protein